MDKAFEFVAKTIGRKKEDPNPGGSLGYGGASSTPTPWETCTSSGPWNASA